MKNQKTKTFFCAIKDLILSLGAHVKSGYDKLLSPLLKPLFFPLQKLWHRITLWIKSFEQEDPETAFYPGALEVLRAPPSPLGRATAMTLCAFFVFAFLWACLGSVDIISTAKGKIVPTGRTKTIQPLERGVVKAIHVRDGQKVNKGDVLIEIDTTISDAERKRLETDLMAARLRIAILNASLKIDEEPLKNFSPPKGASEKQIEIHKSQLLNQVQDINSALNSIEQKIKQQKSSVEAVQATIKKLKDSIPLLEKRVSVRSYLSEKGYGSKLEMLEIKQQLIEHEQELVAQKARLKEAKASVEALKQEKQQKFASYKKDVLASLAEEQRKEAGFQEQLVEATKRYKLQTLTAPVSGTTQQLSIHTEGGVVTPAQALLSIVPSDSKLEVEAMVSNRDIGFVKPGQDVEIKVDTFAFTKYGFLHGKVLSVSHDAIRRQRAVSQADQMQANGAESETSEPQGEELVYAAHISVDKKEMIIDGEEVPLCPGMAITAEIKTGSRRVIEFILSPLMRHQHEALHER